jgi:hypothetical protein
VTGVITVRVGAQLLLVPAPHAYEVRAPQPQAIPASVSEVSGEGRAS